MNGTAIAGATNVTYNATQAGVYKVQVKVNNCASDFSADQSLIVTGDIENNFTNTSIVIYPNPVSDWLTISFGELLGRKEVALFHMSGKKTDSQEVFGNEVKVKVAEYAPGIYMVKVKTENAFKVIRFVKN